MGVAATQIDRQMPWSGEIGRQLSAMEKLVLVVQALSLARDIPTLQDIVRHAARELTGADGATFVLRDGDSCFYADEDAIAPLWKGRRFPLEQCISGWVMLNRTPALIPDIYADPRIPADAYRPTFVKSLAMVPIRTLDPIGSIGNYWAHRHVPTEFEVHLLQALADSTAVAMESIRVHADLEQHVRDRTRELEIANERISQLSLVDDLTGLNNRRGFLLLAEQELKAAARLGLHVFVLFVDADGLKAINDAHGHEAGDAMLRSLAQVLQGTFRKSDVVARLGGDEFCVFGVLDEGQGETAKQRLIDAIARRNAKCDATGALAASVGIYSFAADESSSLEEALRRADKAMYADKLERRRARA
jgi:diguanylate cyclase (GGDEF)-like protein